VNVLYCWIREILLYKLEGFRLHRIKRRAMRAYKLIYKGNIELRRISEMVIDKEDRLLWLSMRNKASDLWMQIWEHVA
jgi:hypothetical protein